MYYDRPPPGMRPLLTPGLITYSASNVEPVLFILGHLGGGGHDETLCDDPIAVPLPGPTLCDCYQTYLLHGF